VKEERNRLIKFFDPTRIDLEMKLKIESAFSLPPDDEVRPMKFNVPFTSRKFQCLKPNTWINDEVGLMMMMMIMETMTIEIARVVVEIIKIIITIKR
jgi:hypothetical protein